MQKFRTQQALFWKSSQTIYPPCLSLATIIWVKTKMEVWLPSNPVGHKQLKASSSSRQVPPLRQESCWQSSTLVWQCWPVKPTGHSQRYVPICSTQVPPFRQQESSKQKVCTMEINWQFCQYKRSGQLIWWAILLLFKMPKEFFLF